MFKSKPFLKPYESIDEERFAWLIQTFLKYFANWTTSIDSRCGNFIDNAKANMFLSWQTYEGLKITVPASIKLSIK